MAYVCPECDYEDDAPGVCPDCTVDLVEEKAETGSGETEGAGSGGSFGESAEDEDEDW